jgi:spore cortex biosynthesis protein YabQ
MSLTTQLETMLAMIGMGSWVGAALDTYGRFLQRSKRARLVVFVNDILFWFLQGLIIFYVLLLMNEGELRLYIFLAILCGYAAYQSLFRSTYLKLLELTIRFFTALYRFFVRTCYYVIIQPIRWLFHLLLLTLLFIWKMIVFIFKALYRCIFLLLTPIRLLGKWFWMIVPPTWKKPFAKILHLLAGVIQKGKNMIIRWSSKFRK